MFAIHIPFSMIFMFALGVLVALNSLFDQNKIVHLMKPEHNFQNTCFLECIK